jgi:hypothetical protein
MSFKKWLSAKYIHVSQMPIVQMPFYLNIYWPNVRQVNIFWPNASLSKYLLAKCLFILIFTGQMPSYLNIRWPNVHHHSGFRPRDVGPSEKVHFL